MRSASSSLRRVQLYSITAKDHSFRLGEEPVDHLDAIARLDASVGVAVGDAEEIARAYEVTQSGKRLAGSKSPMCS